MTWKPEDLFKKGNGSISEATEHGWVTRWYKDGALVSEMIEPVPTVQRNGQWYVDSDGVDDVSHLNSASLLPPVACPLLIEVDGRLLRAERTGIIASKSDGMEYRLDDGTLIHGRFRWTYP